MLNYCNNIAHLCLRASQSLFITSHLMHARWITSFRVPVSGGYGVLDPGGVDSGYRTWDGHRGFRTSGVVDEQLQLLI